MPALVPFEAKAKALRAIHEGLPTRTACALAGIGKSTFYRHVASDPEFAAAVEIAEAARQKQLVEDVRTFGRGDWRCPAWLLERTSEDFRERKTVDVQVQNGVRDVIEAARPHMSEGAYREFVAAIAIAQGLDPEPAEEPAALPG